MKLPTTKDKFTINTIVDWDKPIQLKDGKPCRLICDNRKAPKEYATHTHIILVLFPNNEEIPWTCDKFGNVNSEHNVDVINR